MKHLSYLTTALSFLSLTALVGTHSVWQTAEAAPNRCPFVFIEGNLGITSTGEIWRLVITTTSMVWTRETSIAPLPIPVSEIVYFTVVDGRPTLLTRSGDGWWNDIPTWHNFAGIN